MWLQPIQTGYDSHRIVNVMKNTGSPPHCRHISKNRIRRRRRKNQYKTQNDCVDKKIKNRIFNHRFCKLFTVLKIIQFSYLIIGLFTYLINYVSNLFTLLYSPNSYVNYSIYNSNIRIHRLMCWR